ncbi:hypothetical protein BJ741DRAFT_677958 [Chytriomyces cf. hyalinus JEL632]|nr:hypothetical protein BJ741DRAFT_677958 [Chytriomyces cf. hyalinus JEL632]
MLALLSSEADSYDLIDNSSALDVQQEISTLKETVTNLKATVTNQEQEIDRLASIIKRQHEDDKVYYKAYKEGLSLVEADRFKTEVRMNAPPAASGSILPVLARKLPPRLSEKDKKCVVLKAVQEICLLWERGTQQRGHKGDIRLSNAPDSSTNATIAAHFKELLRRIPDNEAAINLVMASHKQSPQKLVSNHSVAAKLLQETIADLEEGSEMISYLRELTEKKVETAPQTFSALDSMLWACLVSWTSQVKNAVEPTRKILKPQNSSGSTPCKVEPAEIITGVPMAGLFNSIDTIGSIGLKFVSAEKKVVNLPKPANFLWKKATYSYVNTADIEGAALQNIVNLSSSKVNRDDLMAVLSSVELGLQSKSISFADCTHLSTYKLCCQQFLIRLSVKGFSATAVELPALVYRGLITLLTTLRFSDQEDSTVAFITTSLDIDDLDTDVTQLLKSAYTSAVNSSIGIETIQFLIHSLLPNWDIPHGSTLSWIGNLCKKLGIETHETSKIKETSFEDAVHLLMFLSLCPETDDFLSDCSAIFRSMRLLCDLVLRLHFQRADSKSFWEAWRFPPTNNECGPFFALLHVPLYFLPQSLKVGVKSHVKSKMECSKENLDMQVNMAVNTPPPTSRKRSVQDSHSSRSVRSRSTRSKNEVEGSG